MKIDKSSRKWLNKVGCFYPDPNTVRRLRTTADYAEKHSEKLISLDGLTDQEIIKALFGK